MTIIFALYAKTVYLSVMLLEISTIKKFAKYAVVNPRTLQRALSGQAVKGCALQAIDEALTKAAFSLIRLRNQIRHEQKRIRK